MYPEMCDVRCVICGGHSPPSPSPSPSPSPTLSSSLRTSGFVATNWGTEMPFAIRMLVRGLQVFGKSRATCGETLGGAWLKLPAGFHLMTESGGTAAKTAAHAQVMRSGFWAGTETLLAKWLQR